MEPDIAFDCGKSNSVEIIDNPEIGRACGRDHGKYAMSWVRQQICVSTGTEISASHNSISIGGDIENDGIHNVGSGLNG